MPNFTWRCTACKKQFTRILTHAEYDEINTAADFPHGIDGLCGPVARAYRAPVVVVKGGTGAMGSMPRRTSKKKAQDAAVTLGNHYQAKL